MYKHDRWAIRILGVLFLAFISLYILADWTNILPEKFRIMKGFKGGLQPELGTIDPERYLGTRIGDTYYSLFNTTGTATIRRPEASVKNWKIPSVVFHKNRTYYVTAIEPAAIIHAPNVEHIVLPPAVTDLTCTRFIPSDAPLKTISYNIAERHIEFFKTLKK